MFKKFTLAVTALAMGSAALVSATPASAQRYNGGYYGDQYDNRDQVQYRDYRGDRGYYRDDRANYRDNRNYRDDRRYYNNRRSNRCDNTGGTVIGAIAGGLLGNTVAGRGDRLLGTVLGAGAGALAGRAIDRSDDPRGCRR